MHSMKNKTINTHSQFHKQSKICLHRSITKHLKKNYFSTQHSMTAVGRCIVYNDHAGKGRNSPDYVLYRRHSTHSAMCALGSHIYFPFNRP